MDASTTAAWRDLYIGMVGAGASLTGLTFVAIALDPHQIERTPLLRLRAASALWCFVSVMFHRARGPYAQTLHHGGVAGRGCGRSFGGHPPFCANDPSAHLPAAASRRHRLARRREHLRVPPRRCWRLFADRCRAGLGVCHASAGKRDHAVERDLRELAAGPADRVAVKGKALSYCAGALALSGAGCRLEYQSMRNSPDLRTAHAEPYLTSPHVWHQVEDSQRA